MGPVRKSRSVVGKRATKPGAVAGSAQAATPAGPQKRGRGRPVSPALRARRQEQILDAAALGFAAHGYAGLDVEKLAATIGVGKGTVYRYFPTKEALFLATIDRRMRALIASIDAEVASASTPMARIERGVYAFLGHLDAHPDLVELIVHERAVFKDRRKPTFLQYHEANEAPWSSVFRQLVRDGEMRDVPVARFLDTMSYALWGAIFTNHFLGRRRSFEEQAGDILDVAFWGVRTGRPPVEERVRR